MPSFSSLPTPSFLAPEGEHRTGGQRKNLSFEVGGKRLVIRPYQPGDRVRVRAICANTGFLGKPIDPIFEDRELFADYLTSYYTDAEPESTFVVEQEGEVKGYLMGNRFPLRKKSYERKMAPRLVLAGLWRCFSRPYGANTRGYLWWIVTQARKENPLTPSNLPHFHFNVLPEARSLEVTRQLFHLYCDYLLAYGHTQVYGQVVAYDNRRGPQLFKRYGFAVIDTREVTKYRKFHSGKIYLFTILKNLSEGVGDKVE